jgi:hypothetical protein
MQGGSYANDGGRKLFPGANTCRQAPVKEKISAASPAINLRLAVARHKHLFYPFLILLYGACAQEMIRPMPVRPDFLNHGNIKH